MVERVVLKPGDMFDIISKFSDKKKRYLYCGKKSGVRILLSIPKHEYTPVPNDFFRGQTGRIKDNFVLIQQNEEQLEFHRRVAKRIMRKGNG